MPVETNQAGERTVAEEVILEDPCYFSPSPRHARALARFYAERFKPGQRVLDIGFGQGHFLDAARDHGIEGIGLDRDPALATGARERGHEIFCGQVQELPGLLNKPLDGALACHLIEHLQPDEVKALCADVADLVKRDGNFVLATPNFRDLRVATEWFWLDPSHVRPYPEGALRQLIDHGQWRLADSGYEPTILSRDTPRILLNRLRFGREYGRAGRWYELRRL